MSDAERIQALRNRFGFFPATAKVLLALYRTRSAMQPEMLAWKARTTRGSVKVHACYIRSALGDEAISRGTRVDNNYSLTPTGRSRVEEALAQC